MSRAIHPLLTLLILLTAATTGCAPGRADEKPAHTNRLAQESSPYLLQHAHNPVDWFPWGPEAFAKAKKEGKPILLSIGYSSCHWCHVMERESFEDAAVARLLNDHFVAIKVDREERPDLDEVYMNAVLLINDGKGGWPMTTFLTPEGKPFFGGTYFPRDVFMELVRKVKDAWAVPDQRKQLEALGDRVAREIGRIAEPPEPGQATPALVPDAVRKYVEDLDPKDGGFLTGGQAKPKFPPSMKLALLLADYGKKPTAAVKQALTLTLDHMARGGLYDQVGGGFHRYTVDERWLVPHFEKMLYDNALLAAVYLRAGEALGVPYYRQVGRETLDFVLRELADPAGGFWSTLDADSPGPDGKKEEGRFYTWTPDEVIAVLGRPDGELFCRVYDITTAGNFQGRSIPNLLNKPVEAWAKELKTTPAALWARLNGLRTKLLAERSKRPRPALDDKVLASWNGLMLRALAAGYEVTGEVRYREAGEKAAEFLLTRMRREGRLGHSYRAGKLQPHGFLEDYSFLIAGLLDQYQAAKQDRWLGEAQALGRRMVADFWDGGQETLFSTPTGHETLLARPGNAEDSALPSGQSMAALALVRLARLTRDPDFRAKAQRVLNGHAMTMRRFPAAMPAMLLAVHAYFTAEEGSETAPGVAPAAGRIHVTAEPVPRPKRAGEVVEVTLRLSIPVGWHVNAEKPSQANLIPTRAELAPGPFELLSVTYPPAKRVRLGISREPLDVYEGEATLRLRVKATAGAERAEALRVRVRYQACSDTVCDLPAQALVAVPLRP